MDCAEAFYEEQVKQELSSKHGDHQSKNKVLEMIKRSQEQGDDDGQDEEEIDSDDEEDLSDRLAGIDLDQDPDEVWKRLTAEERADFERLVTTGEISKLLPKFKPWWEWEGAADKVVEVKKKGPPDIPEIDSNISSLPSTFKPSLNVKYGLVNALYAYSYAVKYFESDHLSRPVDFSALICDISSSLGAQAANFDSFDLALESAAQAVNVTGRWVISSELTRGTKKDVVKIVKGCTGRRNLFLFAALSDLKKCLSLGSKELKKTNDSLTSEATLPPWKKEERSSEIRVDPTVLKKAVKKVEFYLSWVKDYHCELDVLRD